jgi:hypothetical protein
MNKSDLAMIVAAVAQVLDARQAKKPTFKATSSYKPANKFTPKGPIPSDGATDRQVKNMAAVAKAFAKQGLQVVPKVDALTYKGWLKKGMRVNKGAKGTFVKGVGTVFHAGQVSRDTTFDYLKTGSFPA